MSRSLIAPRKGNEVQVSLSFFADAIYPHAIALVDAFNVPKFVGDMIAPIAGDWVKYNATDNQGEFVLAKL